MHAFKFLYSKECEDAIKVLHQISKQQRMDIECAKDAAIKRLLSNFYDILFPTKFLDNQLQLIAPAKEYVPDTDV